MAGREYRLSVTALLQLVATVSVLVLCAKADSEGLSCPYKYTQHLNHNPTCDPYPGGEMMLECIVEVPLEATDISVGWFLNCQQLENAALVQIVSQTAELSDVRRITSQLAINDLTEDYVGEYTCNILGDEEYIPSDLFMLPTLEYLEIDLALGPCPDGDVLGIAAGGQVDAKCADITENRTIPLSLSCEVPPSTTSPELHVTSTPVSISRTPSPSLPSTTSFPHPTTNTQHTATTTSSQIPTSTVVPISSDPTTNPTATSSDTASDPNNSSLPVYIAGAVAGVFFLITVILVIVFVVMCVRCCRSRGSLPVKQQTVNTKHRDSMQPNATYEGDTDSPYPLNAAHAASAHTLPPDNSDYNTIAMGDYETVGPGGRLGQGSDYQRLQRPTLTPSMMTRFVSSPEATVFSPNTTMTTTMYHSLTTLDSHHPTKTNGRGFGAMPPPPLPSTSRPGNLNKMPTSPESTINSPFHNESSLDVCSPVERGRIDSTSLLLPPDKKGSPPTSADFEGLYSPRGHPQQRNSPSSPRINPLEKIPETGASFPEPENPYPFPSSSTCTYESIPGESSDCTQGEMMAPGVKGYERPLSGYKKPGHHHHNHQAITLPISSAHLGSPPPPSSDQQGRQTLHGYEVDQCFSRPRNGGPPATFNPHHHHNHHHHHSQGMEPMSGPIYHSLEHSNDVRAHRDHNGMVCDIKDRGMGAAVYPETADFTALSSDSGTITPAFPVLSADFAETSPPRRLGQKSAATTQPNNKRMIRGLNNNDHSSDFTGDSDYPQVETDCSGGSSTSAYPDSDWTGGYSTADGVATTTTGGGGGGGNFTGTPALLKLNGAPLPRSGSSTSSSSHGATPPSNERTRHLSGGGRPPSSETTMNQQMSNGDINNMLPANGNCSIMAQYPRVPAGSSHTVPAPLSSGVSGVGNRNGPVSHTMDPARQNNYKKLDPSTMEPQLKYTRLNVGKLTPV